MKNRNEYHRKFRGRNYIEVRTTERLNELKRRYGSVVADELKKNFENLLYNKPLTMNLKTLKTLGLIDIYNKFILAKTRNKEYWRIRQERKTISEEIMTPKVEKTITHKVDIEPLWIDLIPFLVNLNDKEYAIKELSKLAIIGDLVRQAQKKKENLVFNFQDNGEKND